MCSIFADTKFEYKLYINLVVHNGAIFVSIMKNDNVDQGG